jgi:hypothetical protein
LEKKRKRKEKRKKETGKREKGSVGPVVKQMRA